MTITEGKLLLVGDNPFHGISHISEDRARARGCDVNNPAFGANLVQTSLENGATGFMFSVSDTTLSILRLLKGAPSLYAIIPYAYEYVRVATYLGTTGLGKQLAKQILRSGNIGTIVASVKSIATMNPADILKAYLLYELSRIKDATNKDLNLKSVMLHEIITEIIISLDLDWLAKYYISLATDIGIQPGFETRNFAYLVKKFKDWRIDFSNLTIATSFNKIGFQMNPSREDCERAITEVSECNVIAMSTLASGHITVPEAVEYLLTVPNIKGAVIGVSKERQALETFRYFREHFVY
jgi:hypothetical protein